MRSGHSAPEKQEIQEKQQQFELLNKKQAADQAKTVGLDLMIFAGLGTWAVVCLPILIDVFEGSQNLASFQWITWFFSYFLFGILFFIVAKEYAKEYTLRFAKPMQVTLLVVMTCLVTYMQVVGSRYFFSAVLFVLIAAVLPHILPIRIGLFWIAIQSLIVGFVTYGMYSDVAGAVIQCLIFGGFQLFAIQTANIALRETEARQALDYANAELRATQYFLTENSRLHERMRISRDLHDLIGHHLTALSLNLEVASHLADGRVLEQVETSQSIAKSLLTDVREVVSNMRDTGEIDLKLMLEDLISSVPTPVIHLHISEGLECDTDVALVMLRSVQEIVSNSIKHSNAKNLSIRIDLVEDSGRSKLWLRAKDDGQGVEEILQGNGLLGMQERFEELRGSVKFNSDLKAGFKVEGWLPYV